jgi:hypothetical protein
MQVAAPADNNDETVSENYIQFQGARVLWPPDCSDDTLTKSIEQARALLRNYDVDSEGLKVRIFNPNMEDFGGIEEIYG